MTNKINDVHWMQYAHQLADKAEAAGEVPVGAVLIKENEILGEGWNLPINNHDPTAHAEIQAIRAAAKLSENYRLPGTTLYVTLEPCAMCAGAIIHARIQRLVYGAFDPRTGAVDSVFNLLNEKKLNHSVEVQSGVLEDVSSKRLKEFFAIRRK